MLKKRSTNPQIIQLFETIATISEILYSNDTNRTPQQILRLYNATWLHHELCNQLFPKTKSITRTKLFGIYLHALSSHAAPQYELICKCWTWTAFVWTSQRHSSSYNWQESKFDNSTHSHEEQIQGDLYSSLHVSASRIKKEAKELQLTTNTTFELTMITRRLHSWQAHLKRLSPYLILGEGVWWHSTITGYEFHDSKEAPEFQNQGPQLLHFRHTGFKDLEQKKEVAWQKHSWPKYPTTNTTA